jgi:glycosyltransferase involved in cell wall biosynthesis
METTVIHIADFTTPHAGGFVSSLRALAGKAREKGFRCVMVFPAAAEHTIWAEQMQQDSLSVRFLPSNLSLRELVQRICDLVCEEKAEILHTHFSNFNFPAGLAKLKLLFANRRVKVVWHFHSDWRTRLTLKRRVKDLLLYRILGSTAFGIAVSENIRQAIGRRGMPLQRMRYIPNGFDPERLAVGEKSPDTVRCELGIPKQAKVFLAFGWEPVTKGVDLLLAAFDKLASAVNPSDIVLLLIGTDTMRQYVHDWNRGNRPAWQYLAAPRERVSEFFSASDAFVSASRSEGFPYSIVEAMASKLPVVSSNIPGAAWAQEAPGVVFFDPGNVEELAKAITQVLSWTEEERRLNSNANCDFVTERYSVQQWAENILSYYKELLIGNAIRAGEVQ